MICKMFNDECPHCSEEVALRVVRASDIKTGNPVVARDETSLGQFCNNHQIGRSGWIEQMHWCPARWALHRGVVAAKPAKPKKKVVGVRKKAIVGKKGTVPVAKRHTIGKKGAKKKVDSRTTRWLKGKQKVLNK